MWLYWFCLNGNFLSFWILKRRSINFLSSGERIFKDENFRFYILDYQFHKLVKSEINIKLQCEKSRNIFFFIYMTHDLLYHKLLQKLHKTKLFIYSVHFYCPKNQSAILTFHRGIPEHRYYLLRWRRHFFE